MRVEDRDRLAAAEDDDGTLVGALESLRAGNWLAPGAMLVFEESSDAEVTLPEGFSLDDTRTYGTATIRFLTAS